MSDNKQFRVRNGIQVDGKDKTVNSQSVEVLLQDSNEDIVIGRGLAVPTPDGAGYSKGGLFIKTDAGDGVKGLYENQGTKLLCDFNLIGDISSSEIADNAITSDKLDSSIMKFREVTLTVSEIKNLAATNIELIPATEAGAGFAIIPLAILMKLTAGTEVLSESDDNLALRYSGSTELLEVETTGFIDQASDQNRYQELAEALMTPEENVAIDIDNNGTGEIAGNASDDSQLEVRVYYRIVSVL